jgi:hypothetical protein
LEPRLAATGAAVELTGDAPFFWAGYLLVDLGRAVPAAARAPAAAPAAKPVPSEDPPEDAKPPAAPAPAKPKVGPRPKRD